MAKIICWRSGEVEVVSHAPAGHGCITLATGPRARLERVLIAVSRHAYDGVTLLVPGIPEAEDDDAALAAALEFQSRIERSLSSRRRVAGGAA